jgi:7,8-dihydro-6-hydroxymethylpterin-pyrophosphokinase
LNVYFDDVQNKLNEERKKLQELLADRQEIEEKLKRKRQKRDED